MKRICDIEKNKAVLRMMRETRVSNIVSNVKVSSHDEYVVDTDLSILEILQG